MQRAFSVELFLDLASEVTPQFVDEMWVDGEQVVPIGVLLELALALARESARAHAHAHADACAAVCLRDVTCTSRIRLIDRPVLVARIENASGVDASGPAISICSRSADNVGEQLRLSAVVSESDALKQRSLAEPASVDALSPAPNLPGYELLQRLGMSPGPGLRGLQELRLVAGAAHAQLVLEAEAGAAYVLHPRLGEAALQLVMLCAGESLYRGEAWRLRALQVHGRAAHAPPITLVALACHVRGDQFSVELTSDGRQVARLEGSLPAERCLPFAPPAQPMPAAQLAAQLGALRGPRAVDACERAITQRLSEMLQRPADELDVQRSFRDLGLDSKSSVAVAIWLSEALARPLPETLLFDHPNIARLARALCAPLPASAAAPAPVGVAEHRRAEPVAIIGVGCRLPGDVNDFAGLQAFLRGGETAFTPVSRARGWSERVCSRLGAAGTDPKIGALRDPWLFDHEHFEMSARETISTDPQHRILLEVAWEALEHAGVVPAQLAGSRTGVCIGSASSELRDATDVVDVYSSLGASSAAGAGRIAHVLDLRGPVSTVDTACSSSLVAVLHAVRALQAGDASLMLVGGSSVILSPRVMHALSLLGVLSPTGSMAPFCADADGYLRGEGCAVVVLKRLVDATRDGDRVLAVLAGIASTHDGRTNGFAAPSEAAQVAVIEAALRDAGMAADEVGYVEAHGTATPLGDAIELRALARAYGAGSPVGGVQLTPRRSGPLRVGTIKAAIGHLEAAAGIAGLLKALAVLQGELFAQPKTCVARPKLAVARATLAIVDANLALAPDEQRAAVGVSSFGFTGTNVHAVLRAAPAGTATTTSTAARLASEAGAWPICLSARTPRALRRQARRWAVWLRAHPEVALADVSWTSTTRRAHLDQRATFVVSSPPELASELEQLAERPAPIPGGRAATRGARSIAFVCSGYGGQWQGMARSLLVSEPVFARALSECNAALYAYLGWDLVAALHADAGPLWEQRIDATQPALWAIQLGLAALWRSWGVLPSCVLGHSMGEAAAAYIAGALSLADAARVICLRSQALQRISGSGKMLHVRLPETEIVRCIEAHALSGLALASVDSHDSCVVSGPTLQLEALSAVLRERDARCQLVAIDCPAHTAALDAQEAWLRDGLRGVRALGPGTIPFISSVDGVVSAAVTLDADYWIKNLRRTVRFGDALEAAIAGGTTCMVELSPHPLSQLAIEDAAARQQRSCIGVASIERGRPERASLLRSACRLHDAGVVLDWERIVGRGALVDLPTLAWDRTRLVPALRFDDPARDVTSTPALADEPRASSPTNLASSSEALAQLRELLGATLKTPGSVDDHASLRELGVDSLLAADLAYRIQRRLGVELTAASVLRARTVQGLLALVRAPAGPGRVEDSAALQAQLRHDAILPAEIAPKGVAVRGAAKHVLLTGATGFLGVHVLFALLRDARMTLHCLVRAQDDESARQRLQHALRHFRVNLDVDRLDVIAGDVALPRLGLTEARYVRLAGELDTVVHSAALVDFAQPYAELRATNVTGMLNVLRFACGPRPLRVCFVSSIAVLGAAVSTARSPDAADELAALTEPGALPTGYAQSKWVAEQLVWQAAGRGLHAEIVRPGLLVGSATTGACPIEDIFVRALRTLVLSGEAFEDSALFEGLTPVDDAASAICALLSAGDPPQHPLHLAADGGITGQLIARWLAELGYPLHVQGYASWHRAVLQAHHDWPLSPLRELFGAQSPIPAGYVRCAGARSRTWLEDHGVRLASYDRAHLRAALSYLASIAALPAPRVAR